MSERDAILDGTETANRADDGLALGTTIGGFYERIDDVAAWSPETGGFDFLEVTVGGDSTRLDAVPVERLARELDAAGYDRTVHLPTTYPFAVPVPEARRAALAYLDRGLEVAAGFGAEKAVAHASTEPHDPGDAPLLRETVTDLAARGEDAGVELCVENVGHLDRGFGLETVGEAVADAGASLCLDVGHAYLEVGNDGLREFLASYADLVSHVHVHDARERGDSHVPLGAGELDPTAAAAVADAAPTVAVEVFTDDWPLLADTARRFERAVTGE
ncbi:sugar phosphate isomerase/epimerase family protein [Halobaculum sp. MBLA0147]|uniref:sugar phosphate isomerase/epimerase family protein n=1 Tax=Halobaculum sp. MBLA0147 TaxID=3079934 RepID=UPI003523170D